MSSTSLKSMVRRHGFVHLTVLSVVAAAALTACGGGGDTTQSANLSLTLSDASSEDWALIGVKILSVTLTPQGGGAAVTVYTAPAGGTALNLAQLDQLGELLGNVSIPMGTYTDATLTISANPGDVKLTVSADPSTGFPETPGTSVPGSRIQTQGGQGASGSRTITVPVKLGSPLVVSTTQSNALDLEFDLSHPSFLVAHAPVTVGGSTIWAVNFNGPVRHHRIGDLTRLVLRHNYGTVASIATNNTSITVAKAVPALPITSPETAVSTGQSLTMLADATNGTLFYDLDAKTSATIRDFSTLSSSLTGKYVRVAARFQQDGTLVATRIFASNSFNTVWLSPEGHVVHVNAATNQIVLADEAGLARTVNIDGNTKFFFRTPASALADATPIGTGTAFLPNLARGFKVHVQLVDPLAATWVAQSVDIETAPFDGKISGANTTGFTHTRSFNTAADNYSATLNYISNTSANGKDASGNAITGFKYWDFAFPTLVTSGTGATSSFVSAVGGSVNFGGTVGAVPSYGVSFARWGDPANAAGWSAPWAVLLPTPLPRGTVATALTVGNTFTMSIAGGTTPATVDVSAASGSATQVYQVDRANGIVTVTPQDITQAAGLTALTNGLAVSAPVKVYGVPQANGHLKAYVLTYFTGELPK